MVVALCWGGRAQADTSLSFGASATRVGTGGRALGKGNAFIAIADDATAASWNPAGLTQLERPEISSAVEFLDGESDVDVEGHPEASTTRSIRLEDLNFLSLVMPVNVGRNMVLSLTYQRQFRLDNAFEWHITDPNAFLAPAAEIDETYDQEGELSSLSPALAIDVTKRLSLGVALNIWDHDITGASKFENVGFVQTTHPLLVVPDFRVESESVVDRGTSVVVGGIYRLSKAWTLGAVVKPAYDLHLEETRTSEATGIITTNVFHDILRYPLEVGAGVAWRPSDRWTVGADLSWTQWSRYELKDEALAEVLNPVNGLPVDDTGRCKDAFSCRLGAEYLFIGDSWAVPVRAGLGYDPAPAVERIDDYYTFSVGGGYQRGRYMVDLGYQFRWGPDGSDLGTVDANSFETQSTQHRLLLSLIVYL